MASRSAVAKLPQDVRRWLERSLEENGYGGYELLVELLREKGFEISKSALHRWGQDIERQQAAIRAETEIAKHLSEGTADERDTRSEAVMAMVQTGMLRGLRTIIDLKEGEDPALLVEMLSKVGRNAATMTRASVILKKHQAEIEAAARRALLEEQRVKLDALGSKGGVTEETKAAIREALGIV